MNDRFVIYKARVPISVIEDNSEWMFFLHRRNFLPFALRLGGGGGRGRWRSRTGEGG
jgi:hypothetical protein